MKYRHWGSLGFQADYTEDTELPFEVEGAIRFPRQAQFQPLKFAAGISKNLRIYEHSEVREMTEYFALTEKGSVAAEKIIIATHFPFINTRGSYYLKLYQNRSYVLACAYGKNSEGMYLEADNIGLSLRNLRRLSADRRRRSPVWKGKKQLGFTARYRKGIFPGSKGTLFLGNTGLHVSG